MENKELKITLTLPVREAYAGLADIVGISNDWTEASGITPTDEAIKLIKESMQNNLKNIIISSLAKYYGISQQSLIAQVIVDFDAAATCEVTFDYAESVENNE